MKKLLRYCLLPVIVIVAVAALLRFPPSPQKTPPPSTAPTTGAAIPTESFPAPTAATTVPPTEPAPTEPVPQIDFPDVDAPIAFVYDCRLDTFLLCKGQPEDTLSIASITKLMTCYTAMQYLQADEQIKVTADVLSIVPSKATVADLSAGEILTADMLYQAMLLPSGSDAAHVLAVCTARKITGNESLDPREAELAFAAEMNRIAAENGMTHTHFVNCDGVTASDHYSSIADTVLLAKLVLSEPQIRRIIAMENASIKPIKGKTLHLDNTNYLLHTDSEHYRSQATGMKTGTTSAAGNCVLASYELADRTLIVGIFRCDSYYGRFACANELFDACLAYFQS